MTPQTPPRLILREVVNLSLEEGAKKVAAGGLIPDLFEVVLGNSLLTSNVQVNHVALYARNDIIFAIAVEVMTIPVSSL